MTLHVGQRGPGHLARAFGGISGPALNVETQALALRFTTDPGETRLGLIDACIGALKDAGVWAKLDILYLFAAHDSQAATRNWIQDAFNATPVASPAFTADRGFAGDGSSAHLDTGFNDLTGSGLWTQDSVCAGVYVNADTSGSTSPLVGTPSTTVVTTRISTGPTAVNTRVHTAVSYNRSSANPKPGHMAISRTSATAVQVFLNAASIGSGSIASAAGADASLTILKGGSQCNNDRVACAHFGAGLVPTEMTALHGAILTYLTALGAQ